MNTQTLVRRLLPVTLCVAAAVLCGVAQPQQPTVVGATPAPATTPTPMPTQELDRMVIPPGLNQTDLSDFIAVIYSGHRQSSIEPCGCVKNKLGGIDREAMVHERLQAQGIPVVGVDAGGFLKDAPNAPAILRGKYNLAAWQAMKMDAVNVGYTDLSIGLKFLRDAQTSYSTPFISANIADAKDGKLLFDPYRVVTKKLKSGREVKVGIIGVTRPRDGVTPDPIAAAESGALEAQIAESLRGAASAEANLPWVAMPAVSAVPAETGQGAGTPAIGGEAEYKIQDPLAALRKHLPELKKQCDTIVLLDYHRLQGSTKLLTDLGAGQGVSVAVSGEYETLLPLPSDIHDMKIGAVSFEGRHVGNLMVEMKDAKPGRRDGILVPVSQTLPPVEAISKILAQYTEEVSGPSAGIAVTGQPVKISYIGSSSCVECHKKEFDMWQTTRHANAFASLINQHSQFKQECVKCHVTGFGIDNGFKDYRSTPEFANVQCEVCHGPGYDHVVEQRRLKILTRMGRSTDLPPNERAHVNNKFDAKFCIQCHDAKNDPKFDFARDIKFVNHTQVAQRPKEAATTATAAAGGTH